MTRGQRDPDPRAGPVHRRVLRAVGVSGATGRTGATCEPEGVHPQPHAGGTPATRGRPQTRARSAATADAPDPVGAPCATSSMPARAASSRSATGSSPTGSQPARGGETAAQAGATVVGGTGRRVVASPVAARRAKRSLSPASGTVASSGITPPTSGSVRSPSTMRSRGCCRRG